MTAAALARSHAERVIERCKLLSTCTDVPGETTRLYVGPAMQRVHELLGGWMQQAGLQVDVDGAGNLRGRRGTLPGKRRRLLLGSHLDTVPHAGAYDGVLGVLLGLAAIELLQDQSLSYNLELLGLAEEEGVRFGRPFLGSLALTGQLDSVLLALRDRSGISVGDALAAFGADTSLLQNAQLGPREDLLGYLEVHIEQGPVLDKLERPLGTVRAIAGQTRARITFRGSANHAGTTPMRLRHDALAAAAEWIIAVEQYACATEGLVATIGQIEVAPGASNVVPGEVMTTLDVRHEYDRIREEATRVLFARADQAGARRGVAVAASTMHTQAAVALDEDLTQHLSAAAEHLGHTPVAMVSGAGHDAVVLAPFLPAAMLFVRSPGGVSHHPAESVTVADVDAALQTVVAFLLRLSMDQANITSRDSHHQHEDTRHA